MLIYIHINSNINPSKLEKRIFENIFASLELMCFLMKYIIFNVIDRDLGSIKPLETLGSSGDKKRYIILHYISFLIISEYLLGYFELVSFSFKYLIIVLILFSLGKLNITLDSSLISNLL